MKRFLAMLDALFQRCICYDDGNSNQGRNCKRRERAK